MTLLTGFQNACAYPYVDDDMFKTNSWVSIDRNIVEFCDGAISVSPTPFSKNIINNQVFLPTYDVKIENSQSRILENRIALMAIGANCSPIILLEKLRHKAKGDFILAQAEAQNHLVVHGAFIGQAGTIPATLIPNTGSKTKAIIGFFTPEQATQITTTEQNYDLVQSGFTPILTQGAGVSLEQGAALYVSPWGSLTTDNVNPIPLQSIPSETTLPKMDSLLALEKIASILKHDDTEALFNSLPNVTTEQRLTSIFEIQTRNALSARIHGTPIQKVTMADECLKIGRVMPEIAYI